MVVLLALVRTPTGRQSHVVRRNNLPRTEHPLPSSNGFCRNAGHETSLCYIRERCRTSAGEHVECPFKHRSKTRCLRLLLSFLL